MKLRGYLAGAIRDKNEYDFKWRRKAHEQLDDIATIYDPLAGKRYDEENLLWYIHEEVSTAHFITQSDFWCIDRADFIIFNFLALLDKYEMIGTLTEWGRSTTRSVLRYVIWPKGISGTQHAMFPTIHPFLDEFATKIFHDVKPCLNFVRAHLISLGSR